MFGNLAKRAERRVKSVCLTTLALVVAACSPNEVRTPFTAKDLSTAYPPGFEGVRMFADAPFEKIEAARDMFAPRISTKEANYLALSAGGKGGAYGAGYLNGWSERGDRPEFDLVTGVSAGAFIAPFAFVGSAVDDDLTSFFRDGLATRLNARNSWVTSALGQSIYPPGPMTDLIALQVNDELIDQVARRHLAGARLLVLTTSLDAGRGVIWNMGAIAAAESPDRYDLFRRVLQASASIPAIFAPTQIQSQSGGKAITELHVDGGAIRQLLFLPDAAYVSKLGAGLLPQKQTNLYVIVNQELKPDFAMSRDQTFAIGRRSYEILIRASTKESLTADYEFATSHDLKFQMTHIDADLKGVQSDPFDQGFMTRALALGDANGRAGLWLTGDAQ